jgi:tetratricopeptide (TPR) repeat protein
VQSRILQGLRPKVLIRLAPLLGHTPKALEVWAEALAYEPANPAIWEEISIVLAQLGHLSLAVYAADKALGFRPADVCLHERLAVLLAAQEVGVRLLAWDVDARTFPPTIDHRQSTHALHETQQPLAGCDCIFVSSYTSTLLCACCALA